MGICSPVAAFKALLLPRKILTWDFISFLHSIPRCVLYFQLLFLLHTSIFSFSIHSLLPSWTPGSRNVEGLEGPGETNIFRFPPMPPPALSWHGWRRNGHKESSDDTGCVPSHCLRDCTQLLGEAGQGLLRCVSPLRPAPGPLPVLTAAPLGGGEALPHPFPLASNARNSVGSSVKPFPPTSPPPDRIPSFRDHRPCSVTPTLALSLAISSAGMWSSGWRDLQGQSDGLISRPSATHCVLHTGNAP